MGRRPSWKLPYFNPMNGHWLAGFGLIPHEFDDYHDLCIQWIYLTVVNGILGASGFYLFVAACAWCMRRARQKAASLADHWLIWSMLSILIASMLAMNLVALFGEMFFIYHMFLGLVTNTMVICGEGGGELERSVGVLAEMNGKRVLLRYRLKAGQKLALVRPT
jgi:Trk-type K+ transport system membrane component